MSDEEQRKATREKVRAHRARLRAQGLRPIQIWVPDVRAAGFRGEARRQAILVAESPIEAENQAWLDSMSALFPDE